MSLKMLNKIVMASTYNYNEINMNPLLRYIVKIVKRNSDNEIND